MKHCLLDLLYLLLRWPVFLLVLFAGCVQEAPDLTPETSAFAKTAAASKKQAQGELATPGLPFPESVSPTLSLAADLPPEEQAIVARIKQYFATEDAAKRLSLAQSIQSSKAYDPKKLRGWLHAAALYKPLASGTSEITIPTSNGEKLTFTLRIPPGYTPQRAWPLILAYHPTGGNGPGMVSLLESTLGQEANRYVIAAPTNYDPLNVDSRRSWKPGQRDMLLHLRKTVHLDSDRIYVTGFSQGGYAAWSFATFYSDELAGAIPVASTFDAAPEIPGLWEALLPNSGSVPVLNVWGTEDTVEALGLDLKTPRGTIASLNERVVEYTKQTGQNIRNYRIRNAGHVYQPPRDLLQQLLSQRRHSAPSEIHTRFRYLNQARAYWLEGLRWEGDQWGLVPHQIEVQPGESQEKATGRLLDSLLGTLKGHRNGQEIHVDQRHLAEYLIWIGDGMVDWQKPVRIVANAKPVWERRLYPDLELCLEQAARTRDFDRLHWAGVRITSEGKATLLTAPSGLPVLVDGSPH